MTAWSRFRALDAERRWLVLEAAVTLASVWVGLRTIPLRHLRRRLEAYSRRRPARSASSTAAIAWAVQAAGRRFPGGRTCLVEALTADAMLRRRSYHSEVRLGVRRASDRSLLDGHAWVECDGVVVVGEVDDLDTYGQLRDVSLLPRTQTAHVTPRARRSPRCSVRDS
jgi:hypothetical protein